MPATSSVLALSEHFFPVAWRNATEASISWLPPPAHLLVARPWPEPRLRPPVRSSGAARSPAGRTRSPPGTGGRNRLPRRADSRLLSRPAPDQRPRTLPSIHHHRPLRPKGRVIGSFALEKREVVDYDGLEPVLRQAVISIEDKNFESHWGVNVFRICWRIAARSPFPRPGAGCIHAHHAAGAQSLSLLGPHCTRKIRRPTSPSRLSAPSRSSRYSRFTETRFTSAAECMALKPHRVLLLKACKGPNPT